MTSVANNSSKVIANQVAPPIQLTDSDLQQITESEAMRQGFAEMDASMAAFQTGHAVVELLTQLCRKHGPDAIQEAVDVIAENMRRELRAAQAKAFTDSLVNWLTGGAA